MPDRPEPPSSTLPPPWDRIFSLGTRIFVWGLITAIIYILRPFFLLVFLTFIFAYMQSHGVEGLAHRIRPRWIRVIIVFMLLLGTVVSIGIFLEPHLRQQVVTIGQNYGDWITNANEDTLAFAKQHGFADRLPPDFNLERALQELLGFGDPAEGQQAVKQTLDFMANAANFILSVATAFLLALLFSFLIVLDLPKLTKGVHGLANTKIGFIYAEVAENIYGFCKVLGRAMEAQLIIALFNTGFTAAGLALIGIGEDNLVFLCTIVFLCSFIPVAGVFISSVPICIAALTEGGFSLMLLVVGLITVIHLLEAYVLNPRIYGARLRMNAVLTLIILTLCGKLFGPWGFILGIPVFNYAFSHAIRYGYSEKLPAQA